MHVATGDRPSPESLPTISLAVLLLALDQVFISAITKAVMVASRGAPIAIAVVM
jgi:hypothetical protein